MNRKHLIFLSICIILIGVGVWLGFSVRTTVHAEQISKDVLGHTLQSEWPQQGYDPQRSSYNPNEWKLGPYNAGDLDVLWSDYTPCTINSGPTVANGMVYFGHYCGEFLAVDASTGATIWSQSINTTETSHAVVNGIAYVSARCTYEFCGMVYAFNASNGSPVWTWNPGVRQPLELVIAEGVVYVTVKDDMFDVSIQALDADTGAALWNDDDGGLLAVDNAMLYVTSGMNPFELRVLDALNGDLLWTGIMEGSHVSRAVVSAPYVFVHADNGALYAFDSSGCGDVTCSPLWVGIGPGVMGDGPQPPAVAYGKVFVGDGQAMFAYGKDGCDDYQCSPVWESNVDCDFFPGPTTPPSVANGVVYSPCGTDQIYAFDASNGDVLWNYTTYGDFPLRASPAIADGKLYHAATFDFHIYAFDAPATGIYLYPEEQGKDALPGTSVDYELTLSNLTGQSDRFQLDISENNWPTELSITETPTLTHGSSITFTVSVTVPADVSWYSIDSSEITASSLLDPGRFFSTARVNTRAYAPPQITIYPEEISGVQYPNEVTTRTLIISNSYGVPLTYNLVEDEIPGQVLMLHLDEPPDANFFEDSSGAGNHAACSGATCPESGVEGVFGKALHFNGNHYITIDHNDYFDAIEEEGKITIAGWIRIGSWATGWFDIFDQYEADGDFGWEHVIEGTGGTVFFTPQEGQIAMCQYPFELNEWYQQVMVYDQVEGVYSLYINGEQICQFPFNVTFTDTVGEPAYIGFSPSAGDTHAIGDIDEFMVFNRALSESEVSMLYEGYPMDDIPWLGVYPISGTVPTNGSVPIQVTFDATDMEPGVYTATLSVINNDPLNSIVRVPVTMTLVAPGAPLGVHLSGPDIGQIGTPYTFTAEIVPISTTLPIDYAWQATGQETVLHTGGLSDTVTFNWEEGGVKVITVTAGNSAGSVVGTCTIVITAPIAPAQVNLSGLDAGLAGYPYSFTAEVFPLTTTLPIQYTWEANGQELIIHTGGLSDTVTYTWEESGDQLIVVIADNGTGSVVSTHTITISEGVFENVVYLPFIIQAILPGDERIEWK